jgi:hypothetical protein
MRSAVRTHRLSRGAAGRRASVHVRVIDERGRPIEGARAVMMLPWTSVSTTSNLTGHLSFHKLPPRPLSLDIYAYGYEGCYVELPLSGDAASLVLPPIQLRRARMTLRVGA